MSLPLKYHEGEIAGQNQAGVFDPAELDGNGLDSTFDSRATVFLAQQPWTVIAALAASDKNGDGCNQERSPQNGLKSVHNFQQRLVGRGRSSLQATAW